MRVPRLWPTTDWPTVWMNLQDIPVPEPSNVIRYMVIHEIVPTHDRLHMIRMVPTELCRHCHRADTLQHGLTECGEEQYYGCGQSDV